VRNSIVAAIFGLPRLSMDPKMRTEKEPTTTEGLPPIVVTITPDKWPGRYRTYVAAEQEPLCVSRQPFLDIARKLLERGLDPRTMLLMRWSGSKDWAFRGALGAAAKLTVDEHNSTFAQWKPYSRSAAPPKRAKSAAQVSTGRLDDRALRETTAE
jgi:hypothetical protein